MWFSCCLSPKEQNSLTPKPLPIPPPPPNPTHTRPANLFSAGIKLNRSALFFNHLVHIKVTHEQKRKRRRGREQDKSPWLLESTMPLIWISPIYCWSSHWMAPLMKCCFCGSVHAFQRAWGYIFLFLSLTSKLFGTVRVRMTKLGGGSPGPVMFTSEESWKIWSHCKAQLKKNTHISKLWGFSVRMGGTLTERLALILLLLGFIFITFKYIFIIHSFYLLAYLSLILMLYCLCLRCEVKTSNQYNSPDINVIN